MKMHLMVAVLGAASLAPMTAFAKEPTAEKPAAAAADKAAERPATAPAAAPPAATAPATAEAAVKPASPGEITFAAHNGMYSASGKFESWKFTFVELPDGDIEKGGVVFEVDLASVWEKADKLAAHLRTADFFDVEKFGIASVTVGRATKNKDGSYDGIANVSLHGASHNVPVKFTVSGKGDEPRKVEGTATLKRTLFGIGGPYDPKDDKSITDDVTITLKATLPKPNQQ